MEQYVGKEIAAPRIMLSTAFRSAARRFLFRPGIRPFILTAGCGLVVALIDSPALLLGISCVVLIVVAAIEQAGSDESADIFSPLFLSNVLLVLYALRGFLLELQHKFSEAEVRYALSCLLLFDFFYFFGTRARLGESLAGRLPRLSNDFPKILWPSVPICVPVGLFLFAVLMVKAGLTSIAAVAVNLLAFRAAWGASGSEYLLYLALFLIQVPFWGYLIRGNISSRGRLALAIYWLLITGLTFLTGTRSKVYLSIVGLGVVYHCLVRPIEMRKAAALGLLLLLPLSWFYEIEKKARGLGSESFLNAVESLNTGVAALDWTMRFADGFEGFVEVVRNSRNIDFVPGSSFFNALFLPIPRGWVSNKPYSFNTEALARIHPELLDKSYGEEFSCLGEFYLNFGGPLGIIFGGWVFGVVIGMFQRIYLANRHNRIFVFLYHPLISLPMVWLSSGMIDSEAHEVLLLNLFLGVTFLKLAGTRVFVKAVE